MYVYYERFFYKNRTATYYSASIDTHQITVHETASERCFESLVRKHGSKAVSRSKSTGKVYVRILARRVRVRKARSEKEIAEYAISENYILGTLTELGEAPVVTSFTATPK